MKEEWKVFIRGVEGRCSQWYARQTAFPYRQLLPYPRGSQRHGRKNQETVERRGEMKRLSIHLYKTWKEPYKCFYLPHVSFHAGKEWGEYEGKDYIMYYFFSFEFAFLKRHRKLFVELRTKMYDKWDALPF